MDHFKQLETFVAVATRGSLSAAAAAEGVAPAIIGRRIDALEERLGVKLLVRTTRRITLTFEGSAFLEDCKRILNDLHNAEASVSAGGVKASGHAMPERGPDIARDLRQQPAAALDTAVARTGYVDGLCRRAACARLLTFFSSLTFSIDRSDTPPR